MRSSRPGFAIGAAPLLAAWLALAACGADRRVAPGAAERAPVDQAAVEQALDRATAAADELGQRLSAALGEQLADGTAATAITVCSEIAPAAAEALGGEGLEIRRTSLRYRNPDNAPRPWEREVLERWQGSFAGGELPPVWHEVDAASGELRTLRPILVGSPCLACHGSAAELDPEVRRRLAERYPGDLATGFAVGDLRGAFSVRVALAPPPSG